MSRPCRGKATRDGVLEAEQVQQRLHEVGAQDAREAHPGRGDGGGRVQLGSYGQRQRDSHAPGHQRPCQLCMDSIQI